MRMVRKAQEYQRSISTAYVFIPTLLTPSPSLILLSLPPLLSPTPLSTRPLPSTPTTYRAFSSYFIRVSIQAEDASFYPHLLYCLCKCCDDRSAGEAWKEGERERGGKKGGKGGGERGECNFSRCVSNCTIPTSL